MKKNFLFFVAAESVLLAVFSCKSSGDPSGTPAEPDDPAAKNYGNAGVEGHAYYKDGLVFVGTQSNSHLFLVDINEKKVVWKRNSTTPTG